MKGDLSYFEFKLSRDFAFLPLAFLLSWADNAPGRAKPEGEFDGPREA